MEAFGFVEIVGVAAAVDAVDKMAKAADVHLLSWERKLGGRLVTLIIGGDVSAVQAAVDVACTKAIKEPVLHAVIARPHKETVRMVERSMSRWRTTGDYPWRM